MTTFIVEHRVKGKYVMETVSGVEDIDVDGYKDLLGIWVCDSVEETRAMEDELRRMRHVRRSEQT